MPAVIVSEEKIQEFYLGPLVRSSVPSQNQQRDHVDSQNCYLHPDIKRSSPLWCRWKSDGDPGPLSLSVNNEIETLFAIETLFTTPWIVACPKLLCPWDFQARVLEWVATFFFFSRNLPNPGIEPRSLTLQTDTLPSEPPGKSNMKF